MEKGDNNCGLVSVIFGILSILCGPGLFLMFIYGPALGIILGILGLIFGIIQYKQAKNKWAIAGIILSIIGIVSSVAIVIWLIVMIAKIAPIVQQQVQDLQNAQAQAQQLTQQASAFGY